ALELTRRAAEQFLRSGHVDEGLAALRTILAAVGLSFPGSPRRALVDLAVSEVRLRLRGRSFTERPEADVPSDDLRKADICFAAVVGLSMTDVVYAAGFQVR